MAYGPPVLVCVVWGGLLAAAAIQPPLTLWCGAASRMQKVHLLNLNTMCTSQEFTTFISNGAQKG